MNGDGEVDGDDVSDVANAIKETSPQHPYNPDYDVNRDGLLDQNDIHTVNYYKGTTLVILDFIEGDTTLSFEMPHNAIIRVR